MFVILNEHLFISHLLIRWWEAVLLRKRRNIATEGTVINIHFFNWKWSLFHLSLRNREYVSLSMSVHTSSSPSISTHIFCNLLVLISSTLHLTCLIPYCYALLHLLFTNPRVFNHVGVSLAPMRPHETRIIFLLWRISFACLFFFLLNYFLTDDPSATEASESLESTRKPADISWIQPHVIALI